MTEVVDLREVQLKKAVQRGYRNWISQFDEDFGSTTLVSDISDKTLFFLAQGNENAGFFLFDLIMNLKGLGSGFEFHDLHPNEKLAAMDRYLFLLDRIRFEYMKRLGWLESYPGEEFTLVDLVIKFDQIAPSVQATTPELSHSHPVYQIFCKMTALEKEEYIRKLIPKALLETQNHSTTL
ncbi:hypothetical protein ACFL9T_03115 [Thermodesulfobacteriota bacterium]